MSMDFTARLKRHLSNLISDPLFYVCLIAICDSFRFFRDLPVYISERKIFQSIWIPETWFEIIKEPLTGLALTLLAFATIMTFLPFRVNLSRRLLCAGYFLASFIHFHYWELHHRSHLLIYCLFIMSLMSSKEDQSERSTDLMQGISLSLYSLSGMWKLWYLLPVLSEENWFQNLLEILPIHISHFFMRNHEYNKIGAFLIESPYLSMGLFFCTMILQFSSLLFYGHKKIYPYWGMAILLFHAGTYFLMNISFWQMELVILILFVLEGKIQNFSRKRINFLSI